MIAIVMFTHSHPPERAEYALRAFDSLDLLTASEPFWFHLADDGSDVSFREQMMERARDEYGENTSVTNSEGRGYGASYNLASQITHQIADILLPLEDDWIVSREFDLDPFVKVLKDGHFNCIRMGYIGYTSTLRATFEYYDGRHYLALDPTSPERHVFAGGPRLVTVEYEKKIGSWPEIESAGTTELEVAGNVEARRGVAWPVSDIRPSGDLFLHIGTHKAETGEAGSYSEMQAVTHGR